MRSLREKILNALARVGKRRRIIFSSFALTSVIFISSFLSFSQDVYFTVVLLLICYLVSFLVIPTGINKIERVMLFLLPLYFTLVFNFFFFFLPGRWLTRLPFITIYAVGIYAILLAQNILNIGAAKSLQLFRAAFSINFLFITICSFLLYNLILSFKLNFLANFFLFFMLTFPLAVQLLWSTNPKSTLERITVEYGAFISLLIGQIGLFFSFVPIQSNILALFSTACFYSLGGLFYAYLEERLFKERIREFILVLLFVTVVIILSVRWAA